MSEEQKCNGCSEDNCPTKDRRPDETEEQYQDRMALSSRLCEIKHKILVMSGKGGVGKSTVAANIAVGLTMAGKKVGLMDVDVHGPSIPKILHLEGFRPGSKENTLVPVRFAFQGMMMKVMSIGFLLPKENDAVIWRGPLKMGMIKQFLRDVEWGELDYLVVDSPPGTGDEPLSVAQLIEDIDGAVIVTTPQDLSISDVKKSINFCRQMNMDIIGIVENMSGFACPKCGEVTNLFGAGGGKILAQEENVRFLGSVPIDPAIVGSGDEGNPFVFASPDSEASKSMAQINDLITKITGD